MSFYTHLNKMKFCIFFFPNFLHFMCLPYVEWPPEKEKVKKAADHCRQILNYVNQAVKEAENKQVKRKDKIHRMGLEDIKVV